ncbi:hypothetical protein DV737_g1416, partial [Chaetothyriales sp. CBS 132003]
MHEGYTGGSNQQGFAHWDETADAGAVLVWRSTGGLQMARTASSCLDERASAGASNEPVADRGHNASTSNASTSNASTSNASTSNASTTTTSNRTAAIRGSYLRGATSAKTLRRADLEFIPPPRPAAAMSLPLLRAGRALGRHRPLGLASAALSTPLGSQRTYRSDHHPDPPPFGTVQDAILAAALRRVPEHGFTDEALTLGAKDAGYLDVSVQLFPGRAFDLVNYHLVTQRLALKDKVQFPDDAKLPVGSKIRSLVVTRLRANKDIIHQWQGALAHMSLVENIPASLSELHALSDEIWYLSGDTTVDFSWYTRRASLAAVYASSELFMTTDASPDFALTEEFVDRRLEGAQTAGAAIGHLRHFTSFWASNGVNVARSWGLRI